jgi:hypothetical protein
MIPQNPLHLFSTTFLIHKPTNMKRTTLLTALLSVLAIVAIGLWTSAFVRTPKGLLAFPLAIAAFYLVLYNDYLVTAPAKSWIRTVVGISVLIICTVLAYFRVPTGTVPQLIVIFCLIASLPLAFAHLGREELNRRGL